MNKKAIVWILVCMTFLGVSGTDIYVPALPLIVRDLHTTKPIANSTIMFFTLGMAVAVLFSGVFSNYWGRKKVLDISVGLFALMALLITLAPNIHIMILMRLVQGAACGGIIIVQRLILKDIMTLKEQVHAGGLLATGAILSPAIAPSIGAFIMKFGPWHDCFLFTAVLGFILVALSIIYIKCVGV
jgi:MFS transporter, DHA1 family, multidrug resistance protein